MKNKKTEKKKNLGILIDIDINHDTQKIELCVSICDPTCKWGDSHKAETKNVFEFGETNLEKMLEIAKRNIQTQMEFCGEKYIDEKQMKMYK